LIGGGGDMAREAGVRAANKYEMVNNAVDVHYYSYLSRTFTSPGGVGTLPSQSHSRFTREESQSNNPIPIQSQIQNTRSSKLLAYGSDRCEHPSTKSYDRNSNKSQNETKNLRQKTMDSQVLKITSKAETASPKTTKYHQIN